VSVFNLIIRMTLRLEKKKLRLNSQRLVCVHSLILVFLLFVCMSSGASKHNSKDTLTQKKARNLTHDFTQKCERADEARHMSCRWVHVANINNNKTETETPEQKHQNNSIGLTTWIHLPQFVFLVDVALGVLRGRLRNDNVNIRVRGTSDEKKLMTRTVCRTIVHFLSFGIRHL
jgi:hypothetical protein